VRQFLFDTNVVLDVVLNREPWVASSYAIWQAHDHRHLVGFVSASTITDVPAHIAPVQEQQRFSLYFPLVVR
jgi:predicted nucleic acid-binding protein